MSATDESLRMFTSFQERAGCRPVRPVVSLFHPEEHRTTHHNDQKTEWLKSKKSSSLLKLLDISPYFSISLLILMA